MTGERRETERAIKFWEQWTAQFTGRPPAVTAPGLDEMLNDGGANRFIIAADPAVEKYLLLSYGSNFARLLGLPAAAAPGITLIQQLPERLLPIFTRGRSDAALYGGPLRMEGAIEREDGRRDLYRAVFMPIGLNLVFGAFNSRVGKAETRLEAIISQATESGAISERSVRTPTMPRDEYEAAVAAFIRAKGVRGARPLSLCRPQPLLQLPIR
jgi:hypothetical protein